MKITGADKRRPIYSGVAGRMARAVDAAVGIFAPRMVHEWQRARLMSSSLIAHEAARVSRTNPASSIGSADSDVLADLPKLRAASRDLVRNDPHASVIVDIHEDCVVGDGVRPLANCSPDATGLTQEECDKWNASVGVVFEAWAERKADATGVDTFYGLQALWLRSELTDGDAIAHTITNPDGSLSCELIDADRIESPGWSDTDRIRGGVEIDEQGRHVAFHVYPSHPADAWFGARSRATPIRIASTSGDYSVVQHGYRRKRAGQTRGTPILTPSLMYTKHLHHYLDSELIAARAASNFALFIKRNVSATDSNIMPVQGSDPGAQQEYHETLEPGIIEYLNEGEEPVPYTPNRPGSAFEPFVVRMLRASAAASGLSYEVVCRDFGSMNLSSARAMMRELRRGFDARRARLIRQFCRPWWENVIRAAIANGDLDAPRGYLDNPVAFLAARWVAPTYGMVDPESDIKGSTLAVDANLSDQWSEAARFGVDAEKTLRARARFHAKADAIETEFGLDPGTLTKERPARSESTSVPTTNPPPSTSPTEPTP